VLLRIKRLGNFLSRLFRFTNDSAAPLYVKLCVGVVDVWVCVAMVAETGITTELWERVLALFSGNDFCILTFGGYNACH